MFIPKSLSILFILIFTVTASPAFSQDKQSQETNPESCSGPIFTYKEVSKKAEITYKPEPSYTEDARQNHVTGAVILTIVLCKSGKVTDIEILQKLPHGMTENCLEAAKKIRFKPAENDGRTVSVRIRCEYNFYM